MEDCIRTALEMVDFPPEDIKEWLGGCSGCAERRQKAWSLRQWAVRVVAGTLENPVHYLEWLISEK
jgi:hypothetical protein